MLQKRSIPMAIVLTIVTCGIYGIIWFLDLTNDAAKLNNDSEFSGGKAFIFTLLTCGIYGVYWNYKMGQEIYQAKQKRNMNASDNSILYLVLGLLNLGIVNYCLMQNEINEMIEAGA